MPGGSIASIGYCCSCGPLGGEHGGESFVEGIGLHGQTACGREH